MESDKRYGFDRVFGRYAPRERPEFQVRVTHCVAEIDVPPTLSVSTPSGDARPKLPPPGAAPVVPSVVVQSVVIPPSVSQNSADHQLVSVPKLPVLNLSGKSQNTHVQGLAGRCNRQHRSPAGR